MSDADIAEPEIWSDLPQRAPARQMRDWRSYSVSRDSAVAAPVFAARGGALASGAVHGRPVSPEASPDSSGIGIAVVAESRDEGPFAAAGAGAARSDANWAPADPAAAGSAGGREGDGVDVGDRMPVVCQPSQRVQKRSTKSPRLRDVFSKAGGVVVGEFTVAPAGSDSSSHFVAVVDGEPRAGLAFRAGMDR